MGCNLKNREQIIEDYLSGRLSQKEKDAFEEHLFQCDICYREVRLREELKDTIQKHGASIFSRAALESSSKETNKGKSLLQKIFPSPPPRPVFALASFLLIAAVLGLFWGKWHRSARAPFPAAVPIASQKLPEIPTRSERAGKKQSLSPKTKPKPKARKQKQEKAPVLLAANFEPSATYEEMLASNLRSAATTILSPKIGQKITGNTIQFRWKTSEAGPFLLKILNNRGRELLSLSTEQNSLTLKRKLPPGLYYWKLETEEELMAVGKFLVPAIR